MLIWLKRSTLPTDNKIFLTKFNHLYWGFRCNSLCMMLYVIFDSLESSLFTILSQSPIMRDVI